MASHTASTVAAIASLKTAVPSAQVGFIAFDLTILSAARAAAEEFWERKERIGFERGGGWGWQMAEPCELTADEIELQALNGTGYFTLALPFSLSSGTPPPCQTRTSGSSPSRGCCLSSGRRGTRMRPGVAGRAAVFFGRHILTNELQRRLSTYYYLSVHPRLVATNIYRGTHASYPWLMPFSFLEKYALLSSEQGARAQLSAATAPEVEERDWRAAYLAQRTPSSRAQDEDGQLAAQFEALYEKLVAEAYSKEGFIPKVQASVIQVSQSEKWIVPAEYDAP
ncbi:hypothetical protein B0H14DRAFT_2560813 [Mycena olivaceomarginata]|nr:hypothetical protein B0H14DRAFT_2560813 [Mycena olivaceomarginata]